MLTVERYGELTVEIGGRGLIVRSLRVNGKFVIRNRLEFECTSIEIGSSGHFTVNSDGSVDAPSYVNATSISVAGFWNASTLDLHSSCYRLTIADGGTMMFASSGSIRCEYVSVAGTLRVANAVRVPGGHWNVSGVLLLNDRYRDSDVSSLKVSRFITYSGSDVNLRKFDLTSTNLTLNGKLYGEPNDYVKVNRFSVGTYGDVRWETERFTLGGIDDLYFDLLSLEGRFTIDSQSCSSILVHNIVLMSTRAVVSFNRIVAVHWNDVTLGSGTEFNLIVCDSVAIVHVSDDGTFNIGKSDTSSDTYIVSDSVEILVDGTLNFICDEHLTVNLILYHT